MRPARADTVAGGLAELLDRGARLDDWVLVHDAARCLITPAQIEALIDACLADAVGGLLALKLPDTLKSEAGGRVATTVDRSDKWLAQTPQMFRIGPLRAALAAQVDTGEIGIFEIAIGQIHPAQAQALEIESGLSDDEDRFILLGVSHSLRVILVCHCYRSEGNVIRIISARKASPKESKAYSR